MNRIYSTVWSSAKNMYVVASEKAKSRGKPSSTRTTIASSIVLALTALAAPQALAVTSCNSVSPTPGIITVAGAETGCSLIALDQLTVQVGGSITSSTATPVLNTEISPVTLLDNAGTISFNYATPTGTNPWGGFWSPAVKGSFTTISNSGTIAGAAFSTGGGDGILLTGTSGTLTNTGTISGGGSAIVIGTLNSQTWIGAGSTGHMTNVPGVVGTLSSLTNSGTITGGAGAGLEVIIGSSIGSLDNQAGGTISGGGRGILVNGGAVDSFVNAGTISNTNFGGGVGVEFRPAWTASSSSATRIDSTLSGGLTNSGTISGTSSGVLLDSVTVGTVGTPAHITNATGGQILGGLSIQGSTLHGDIVNQAGALIDGATPNTSTGAGITVNGSTLGSITNSGTIGGGIVMSSNSALSGSITNNVGGLITASGWNAAAIDINSIGNLTRDANFIPVSGTGGIAGDVINSGNIQSSSNGMVVSSSYLAGTLSNAGAITIAPSSSSSSGGVGMSISSSLVGSVSNSGTITTAGGVGVDISNANIIGTMTNTANGSIVASAGSNAGVRINFTTLTSFANQGSIQGGHTGLSLSTATMTGGVSNSGTIAATGVNGRDGVLIGALNAGTSVGAFNNSGTVQGAAAGMVIGTSTSFPLYDGLQTINNSGVIDGQGWTAPPVWLDQNGIGIYLKNASLTSITNSGTISGSVAAIKVNTTTAASTLTDLFIDGNDTAQFNGMVDAQATATTILNGATYTLRGTDDFRVASFTNNGTAQFATGATTFSLVNVTGNTFTNNGVLSVAAGGTATLDGNYTQAANATLRIGASNDTTYGKLVVTGTATLPSNAKINVNVTDPNFSFTASSMAGILTATTLNSDGTFAVSDNSVLFNFNATLNGNAVDLSLAAVPSTTTGGTTTGGTTTGGTTTGGTTTGTTSSGATNAFNTVSNKAGARAAGVIDSLVADYTARGTTGNAGMDAVLAQLGTYTTDAELVAAVMQTVPQVGAAMKRVSAAARSSVTSALASRIRAGSGQAAGDGFVTDGNVWFKPLGGWIKQDDTSTAAGYKANTVGFVAGADGDLASGARIGAALSMTSTNVDGSGGLQSSKVTGYVAALYGSKDTASGYQLDWQADVGYNQNKGTRRISFMNTTASSDYTGTAAHLGAGVARDWTMSNGDVLTPSLHADYTHLSDKAYTETGAGALNLSVAGQTYHELMLAADGMWTHHFADSGSLTANLGVAYNAQAQQDDLSSAYVGGGAAFGTSGVKPSATTPHAGLGYAKTTAGGTEISVRYDVQARSAYTAQSVSAKWTMPF